MVALDATFLVVSVLASVEAVQVAYLSGGSGICLVWARPREAEASDLLGMDARIVPDAMTPQTCWQSPATLGCARPTVCWSFG